MHRILSITEDGVEHKVTEYWNGDKYWRVNNEYHRINGPAIEYYNGDKIYYKNGQSRMYPEPAIERTDGTILYVEKHSIYNRFWGVKIFPSGLTVYILSGVYYRNIKSDVEWEEKINIFFEIEKVLKDIEWLTK